MRKADIVEILSCFKYGEASVEVMDRKLCLTFFDGLDPSDPLNIAENEEV